MNVLVLNTGSSSIKYEVFRIKDWTSLASGLVERIGEPESRLKHLCVDAAGARQKIERTQPVADHRQGIELIQGILQEFEVIRDASELAAIGHRAVHGGETFREPARIDAAVIEQIRAHIPLAPLHNPANIVGMEATMTYFPNVPQVAVFDTAFHHTIPQHAYRYAIPEEIYQQHRARRYGFHGTSHLFVSKQTAEYLGRPLAETNLIVLHLGNGASATAVQGGKSVDTSMGLTPLEGLMMGTRCGDIDPAIIFYLARETGKSNDALETMLNKQSGLKGVCGENDMREIMDRVAAGDATARLAADMFCYRIKKYIGAYLAVLGSVHALVFTAGIGENSPRIRSGCCLGLSGLGIEIDEEANRGSGDGRFLSITEIQSAESSVKVLVVPTNEELEIAREAVSVLEEGSG